MTEFRFPNETDDYRARRDELLDMEVALRAQTEAVAQARRELPLGGRLEEDYVFERVGDDGQVESVPFAALFGDHDQLLIYTMMFGSDWDAPCPSCTSLVDVFNANHFPVAHQRAFAVVAAARPEQCHDWGKRRGWTRIPLYSAAKGTYILDYKGHPDVEDPALASMMNVFKKTDDGIFHTWGSELVNRPMENGHPRHVDVVWPLWNLLDMTPGGRGVRSTPAQDFKHEYFTENVFREEGE